MRAALTWIVAVNLTLLLGVMFVRALVGNFAGGGPGAVERAKQSRENTEHALCEVLHPETSSAALGGLGNDAPDFKLRDYSGREVALSSLRGRVVMVNFWATWCPTCVVEMKSLEQLTVAEKGKNFTLLAVSVDDSWDPVREFFAQGTPLTVLLDPQKSVPPRYGTEKFPETFIIDRDGKVRYYVISDRNWSAGDVKACIDSIIEG